MPVSAEAAAGVTCAKVVLFGLKLGLDSQRVCAILSNLS